jgi:acyl-CoA dehydrogenase
MEVDYQLVDFALNDKESDIKKKAEEYTYKYVTPRAQELDDKDDFPMEVIQKAYEMGLMNLHVPKAAGGPERTLVEEALVTEAVGYGDAGVATSVACNNLAFAPILLGATMDQLKKYIKPLVTGKEVKLAGFGLTERMSGSDAASVQTKAIRDGDEWVINGMKCFITSAPVASLFSVFATTNPELKHKGISVFIVPADLQGVEIGHIERKLGQKASVQSEVIFKDVRVPEDCLVGEQGMGFKLAMMTLDKTRAAIAAIATGVAQRAVDEAAKFCSARKQFGQPIANFQGISFKVADMATRAEAARWLTRYAAWLADHKLPNSKESAFAKTFAGDSAMQNAVDCMQIMGGYGYMREYPAEQILRGAKLLQIYEGTNEVQRIVSGSAVIKECAGKDTGFRLKYEGKDAPQI